MPTTWTLPFLLAAATFTVDDDGPADFDDLPAAIAAASAGDVLLVEPGLYSAFDLDAPLTIVGRAGAPRPVVLGESAIHDVDGFTLSGLELRELRVENVSGRAAIEDCEIGHDSTISVGEFWTFTLEGCAEVVVTGSTLQGKTGDESFAESPGVLVSGSTATFADCTIRGGEGGTGGQDGFPGQPGVLAQAGSLVILAGCDVSGGDHGEPELPIFGCDAAGASAVRALGSTVFIRGSSDDLLEAGISCGFQPDPATVSGTNSTMAISGATLVPQTASGSLDLSFPSPPSPWLRVVGDRAPGGTRTLELFGAAGESALVIGSPFALFAEIGKVQGGPLWLLVGQPVVSLVLPTLGQETAATLDLPLPRDPAFAGVPVWFQAFFPADGGKFFGTNPDEIVLRF